MAERKETGVYELSEEESAKLLRLTQKIYLVDPTGWGKEKVTLIQPNNDGRRSEGILYQYKDENGTDKFVAIPLPGSNLENFIEEVIIKK